MRNPYQVLGVAKSAEQAEIKRAYRKLAKELHPDRHPGDDRTADRFKEVSAAYNIVGDEDLRGQFDRGEIDEGGAARAPRGFHRAHAGPGQDPFGRHGFGFGGRGSDPFSDLFRDFAGAARRTGKSRGANRRYGLKVAFMDAAVGSTRRLDLAGGKTLDVKIPAGVKDGTQIRLKHQGEPGEGGGEAGDALIEVEIMPHAFFRRDGNDIHLELPITLQEALLGAKIEVPTVHGSVTLTVPPGSNTGSKLRLRNKGVVKSRGKNHGDQYVTLQVVLPEKPDAELKKLIQQWAKGNDYDVRRKRGLA